MILKKLFAVLVMCVALLAATPVWAYDVYYLNFADGRTLGFGEALSMYYFFSEEDEAIAYVVWDFHKYDELVDLYKQLREKYRAQVQETLQLD